MYQNPHKEQSDQPLSYFGQSLTNGDFKGNGKKEVFVGAPGYSELGLPNKGAVYKTDYSLTNGINFKKPYLSLKQQDTRFGFSLATVDINHDGIDDLVVSAPAEGPGGPTDIHDYYPKYYYGAVYVYLG